MEGFRYVDIFSTKGLEYLLVIGFLVLFGIVWTLLRKPTQSEKAASMAGRVPGPREWFGLRDALFYHPGHAWAAPMSGQVVRVGIDDFAQKLLGEPGFIDLPEVGSHVLQGGKGWRLGLQSKAVDMVSPVGGEVVAINEEVLKSPNLLSDDPYGDGWLLEVRVPRRKSDLKNLLSGRYAKAWMDETVHALRERMAGDLGVVLQDGGLPVSGFAMQLSRDNWDEIAAEFLLSK